MSAATPNTFSSSALLVSAGAASAGRNSPAAASNTNLLPEAGRFKDTLQQLRPETAAARTAETTGVTNMRSEAKRPGGLAGAEIAAQDVSSAPEVDADGAVLALPTDDLLHDEQADLIAAEWVQGENTALPVASEDVADEQSTLPEGLTEPQPELAPLVAEACCPSGATALSRRRLATMSLRQLSLAQTLRP